MGLNRLKKQEGQAIVESALAIPIILVLILGMVEIGRVTNAYLVVTHAARQGARYGAVGAANEVIIENVKAAAAPLNPAEMQIEISPVANRVAGDNIQVRVDYPVLLITPLANKVINNPFVVSSSITMRME